jgi:hypothetical protein
VVTYLSEKEAEFQERERAGECSVRERNGNDLVEQVFCTFIKP